MRVGNNLLLLTTEALRIVYNRHEIMANDAPSLEQSRGTSRLLALLSVERKAQNEEQV